MNPNSPLGQIMNLEMESIRKAIERTGIDGEAETIKSIFVLWARKNYSLRWGGWENAFMMFAEDYRTHGRKGILESPPDYTELNRLRRAIGSGGDAADESLGS